MDLSLLDYLWEIVPEAISKLPWSYSPVLSKLIVVVLIVLIALNIKPIWKRVETHRKKLNWLFITIFLILILCPVPFFIADTFYSPKPSEDQLVVAISPFYHSDVYTGKSWPDKDTAIDFKERLEAEKNLEIKVILLDLDEDNLIRNSEDAKFQGKKIGAHLVVYGETKRKIGYIEEVKYYILPLSIDIIPSEMPSLEARTEEVNGLIITGKASFHSITENPITIIESLKENASSSICIIGAFENYKKSNFTSAITFFKSIKNYESYSSILFYIANCYYFDNNLNKSLQYFGKSIEINPQSAEAWNNKGAALDDLGRFGEAIVAYDNATEINPQLAEAWYNKGNALKGLGRFGEAIAAYDNATEINPQLAEAWYNKGIALSDLGWYEEAIAAYDKAPQSAEAWNNKGATLDDLGRYEEAIAAHDKATKINPQLAEAWYNKGNALKGLGRYEEAIVAYDKAIKINPQLTEAWNNKGTALKGLGRYKEAIAAYDEAIEINPQLAKVWCNKGIALGRLGMYEEAKEAFEKAHEIDPTIEIP